MAGRLVMAGGACLAARARRRPSRLMAGASAGSFAHVSRDESSSLSRPDYFMWARSKFAYTPRAETITSANLLFTTVGKFISWTQMMGISSATIFSA